MKKDNRFTIEYKNDRAEEVFSPKKKPFPIWSIVLLAMIAFGVFKVSKFFQIRQGPPISRKTEQPGEPCYGKPACVFVYVAPWCPACNASTEVIQAMHQKWNQSSSVQSHGIRVVVGQDKPEKNDEKARELGTFATVDRDGHFAKTQLIDSYPTWIVVDARGKVTKRFSGSITDPGMIDLFASSKLGITENSGAPASKRSSQHSMTQD